MTIVRRLDDKTKTQAIRFVHSWDVNDAYRRFGSAGIGGQDWLTAQLALHRRPALVAVHESDVVGLLDHVAALGATHIGIVVGARYRKQSIGTALVKALLQSPSVPRPIVADCDNDNVAGMALLRKCGFTPVSSDGYQTTWQYDLPAEVYRSDLTAARSA